MADKTYQTTLLIRGDSRDAVRSVNLTREELEKLTGAQKRNTSITDKLNKSYKAMGIGLAAAGAVATAALYKVVQNTEAQDAAVAQLNSTLKSTGGASGKFADELINTAGALQQVTTYGDEAIIELQSLLLTFKDIKGDNFDRTTEAALDMATAMKVDLKSAALQLGKALNDPAGQLSALTRSGITFSDAQKDMIKSMVEAGDKASAQKIILQELESQFGGSAAAATTTMGGALKQLSNNWGDLFEAEKEASAGIVDSIHAMNDTISSPEFKDGMQTLVSGLLDITTNAVKAMAAMANFSRGVGESIARLVAGTATDDVAGLEAEIERLTKSMADLERVGQTTGYTYESLKDDLDAAKEKLRVFNVLFGEQAVVVGKTTETVEENTVALEEVSVAATRWSASTGDLTKELNLLAKAAEKTQDQIDKNAVSFQKAHSELDGIVRKTEDYIKALKFETEQTTRSAREQAIENDVRAAGSRVTEEQTARIREASAAKYDAEKASSELAEAEQNAARESEQAWSSARDTLSNFFFEMAADGKNAFDTLVDGFRAMISKMLAEAAANQILIGVGALVGGGSSSASASASGGTGTALSGASSLSSFGSLFSGASSLGQGLYAGASDALRTVGFDSAANAASGQAGAYGAMSNGQALAYGAANIGAGIVGSYAGQQVFDGNTTGVGAAAGGVVGSIWGPIGTAVGSFIGEGLETALGNVLGFGGNSNNWVYADIKKGSVGDSYFTDEGSHSAQFDAINAVTPAIQEFINAVGGGDFSGQISASAKHGFQYNGLKTTDAETLLDAVFRDVVESSKDMDSAIKDMILSFDGGVKEFAQFAATLSGVDQAIDDVDGTIIGLLDNFKGSSSELSLFASAIVSLRGSSGLNAVTQALKGLNKEQLTAAQVYERHTDLLRKEIRLFDGTAESAQQMAAMLTENQTAAYNFTLAIKDMGKSLGEVAASQAQSIRDAARSEEELLIRRVVARDMLIDALENVTDPTKASTLQQSILDLNQTAFNSLSEAQKIAQADSFAAIAESTNETFQQTLKNYTDGLSVTQNELNARVISALEKAAGDQRSAAQTQKEAANLMIQAARLFTDGQNPFSREATIQ